MSQSDRPIPPLRPAPSLRPGLWPWGPVLATATLLSGLLSAAPWHLA